MRSFLIFISIFFFCNAAILGQTKVIIGKVVDQDLSTVPGITINNADNGALGSTDMKGNFTLHLPTEQNTLIFIGVGFERTPIQLSDSCRQADVILIYNGIYDFMTFNKINRIRKRLFKKLPELYKEAYKKNLFTVPKPCYERSFVRLFPLKRGTD